MRTIAHAPPSELSDGKQKGFCRIRPLAERRWGKLAYQEDFGGSEHLRKRYAFSTFGDPESCDYKLTHTPPLPGRVQFEEVAFWWLEEGTPSKTRNCSSGTNKEHYLRSLNLGCLPPPNPMNNKVATLTVQMGDVHWAYGHLYCDKR